MTKGITPEQKEILDLLNKVSVNVDNCVYLAKNYEDANVKDKIETAVWYIEHFMPEIKEKVAKMAVNKSSLVEEQK